MFIQTRRQNCLQQMFSTTTPALLELERQEFERYFPVLELEQLTHRDKRDIDQNMQFLDATLKFLSTTAWQNYRNAMLSWALACRQRPNLLSGSGRVAASQRNHCPCVSHVSTWQLGTN
jgi:hypothetical protein